MARTGAPNPRRVSLYRTWRPLTFADLVGQDAVVRTLTTAIESGKLAHAYLFSGPRGSGKTSAAKILARCIECVNGPTATPDNTCENCLAMLAGTAFDVIEIDAASNRGIDEIRALRDAVKFAPSAMRSKVYIIDEAHMLTKEGANAFLKTLEEPPPHVVFILATTAPETLPPTILSRCQRYAFRRIPIQVMIERMREIAAAEKHRRSTTPRSARSPIAPTAVLRDALTMLEQVAAFAAADASTRATRRRAFGQTGRDVRAHAARRIAGAATPRRRCAPIDDASDAGSDMPGADPRADRASFATCWWRASTRSCSRAISPPTTRSARRKRAQGRCRKRASCARCGCSATRWRGARLAATRGSNSRPRCCASCCRPKTRRSTRSARASAALEEGRGSNAVVPAAPPSAATPPPVRRPPAKPPRPKTSRNRSPQPARPAAAAQRSRRARNLRAESPRAVASRFADKVESERPPLRIPLCRARSSKRSTDNAVILKLRDAASADMLRDHTKMIEAAIADVLGRPLKVTLRIDGNAARSQGEPPPDDRTGTRAGTPTTADALFNYASERIR